MTATQRRTVTVDLTFDIGASDDPEYAISVGIERLHVDVGGWNLHHGGYSVRLVKRALNGSERHE